MSDRQATDDVPDLPTGQRPAKDRSAFELAERARFDDLRKKLSVIRGEILETAEQGSQHGLVDMRNEIAKLAQLIKQLEVLFGAASS